MKKAFIESRFCFPFQFLKRKGSVLRKGGALVIALFLLNTNLHALYYVNEISFCSSEKFLSQIKKTDNSSLIHCAAKTYGDVINSWIFDKTVGNVDFYHLIAVCGRNKVVFLKFNNKNSYKVNVSWQEVFITKQKNAEKTEGPFRQKQLVLLPGETSQSDCENIKQDELLARPDQTTPVYRAQITKFIFKDVIVTR